MVFYVVWVYLSYHQISFKFNMRHPSLMFTYITPPEMTWNITASSYLLTVWWHGINCRLFSIKQWSVNWHCLQKSKENTKHFSLQSQCLAMIWTGYLLNASQIIPQPASLISLNMVVKCNWLINIVTFYIHSSRRAKIPAVHNITWEPYYISYCVKVINFSILNPKGSSMFLWNISFPPIRLSHGVIIEKTIIWVK